MRDRLVADTGTVTLTDVVMTYDGPNMSGPLPGQYSACVWMVTVGSGIVQLQFSTTGDTT